MYQHFYALAQDIADMEMGDEMTKLRLQKILYYAQGWMLKRHEITLFSETIEDPPPDQALQLRGSPQGYHRSNHRIPNLLYPEQDQEASPFHK